MNEYIFSLRYDNGKHETAIVHANTIDEAENMLGKFHNSPSQDFTILFVWKNGMLMK